MMPMMKEARVASPSIAGGMAAVSGLKAPKVALAKEGIT